MFIKRGDVFYADLRPVVGSEQGGVRPVLVIQNNTGNKYSPTVIVAVITSKHTKAKMPTHMDYRVRFKTGMEVPSQIMFEQVRTIDKRRLKEKVCTLSPDEMEKVNDLLKISFDLS